MRTLLLTAFAITVAACVAPLPRADPAQEAEGKLFSPPPSGRAALYVTAAHRHGGAEVTLGQRTLGVLDDHSWLRVDVRPGVYTLRCKYAGLSDVGGFTEVDLRAGETVFVSTRFAMLGGPYCRLAVQTSAEGRAEVLSGSRVKEISGASD